MSIGKEKDYWLRFRIPDSQHEKLLKIKKDKGVPISRSAVEALSKGLDVTSGSRIMVRALEENDFIELSDYFDESQELSFMGHDILFFLERYDDFLKGKVANGVNMSFVVEHENGAIKATLEELGEKVKVLPLLGEGTSQVNLVHQGYGSRMVVWFNSGMIRGPFMYFDKSSDLPASRFHQLHHDILTGKI